MPTTEFHYCEPRERRTAYMVPFHGFLLTRRDGRRDENFDEVEIVDEERAKGWLNEMAAKEGV